MKFSFKMAAMCYSRMFNCTPIIVVLGATGTGKSKLAINLAKRFNGEIINGDAMQMYQGLNIATNKVTVEEQDGITHHLLGFLEPTCALTALEFRNKARTIIKEIVDRKNLPIIVGGTYYYIESVLYDMLLKCDENKKEKEEEEISEGENKLCDDSEIPKKKLKTFNNEEIALKYDKLSNAELHQKLSEMDPEAAETIHPNDRRKVMRCVMHYEKNGVKISEILKKQRSQEGGSNFGGPLVFKNSMFLWLKCDPNILNTRLDERVDSMISLGLLDELLEFHENYNKELLQKNMSPDYKNGIFQSIGFKEFHEYMVADKGKRESKEGEKLLKNGVELMKVATRQYARRQLRWFKNRFLNQGQRQVPPIYELDSTDLSKWKENVCDVAEQIVECHLAGRQPPVKPLPITCKDNVECTRIDKLYKCEVCDRILLGKKQFEMHMKGNKHKRVVKTKKRLEEAEKGTLKKVPVETLSDNKLECLEL